MLVKGSWCNIHLLAFTKQVKTTVDRERQIGLFLLLQMNAQLGKVWLLQLPAYSLRHAGITFLQRAQVMNMQSWGTGHGGL